MNILLASTEVNPFAKAGGMADITSSLPIGWQKFGQNPIIVMPKYAFIDADAYGFKPTDIVLYVPISYWMEFARLWEGKLPGTNVPVYLIENKDYFNRWGIYGDPHEYLDNDRRFIFFSRAALETAKALGFSPDIVHAHDFHTAFIMAFLKTHYLSDYTFTKCAGVYTIHNLAYQGWFNPLRAMDFSGLTMSNFYPGSWFEFKGMVNAMKVGIMFADKITTVSPTYAREIRFPYYAEGMEDSLNQRAADLIGILNGVNYEEWNPENDKLIYQNYSQKNIENKLLNKHKLLHEFGLSDDDNLDIPLIGMVSRLTEQKGIDILMVKLEEYLANGNFRFILIGSGDRRYEDYFNYLKWKYPKFALIYIGFDNAVAHKIIAGSDYIILPSRFEPSGLTQMFALKYGTIPIVRSTGGLADSVKEYVHDIGEGTGFLFMTYNADDFAYAIRRALSIYNSVPHWDIIRKNGMLEDFSSSKTALEYLRAFKWALERVKHR